MVERSRSDVLFRIQEFVLEVSGNTRTDGDNIKVLMSQETGVSGLGVERDSQSSSIIHPNFSCHV